MSSPRAPACRYCAREGDFTKSGQESCVKSRRVVLCAVHVCKDDVVCSKGVQRQSERCVQQGQRMSTTRHIPVDMTLHHVDKRYSHLVESVV
jgi:hypothetical protein